MDYTTIREILHARFLKYAYRHPEVNFEEVSKLIDDKKLWSTLIKMEESGGEPDLIRFDGRLVYVDFSKESPKGRRSLCYDEVSRKNRKKFPPISSALEEAYKYGSTLIDAEIYKAIQKIEPLDLKTSSWLLTPPAIKNLGGALFGDNRYEAVFIYHNGADSYYENRGFRTIIWL